MKNIHLSPQASDGGSKADFDTKTSHAPNLPISQPNPELDKLRAELKATKDKLTAKQTELTDAQTKLTKIGIVPDLDGAVAVKMRMGLTREQALQAVRRQNAHNKVLNDAEKIPVVEHKDPAESTRLTRQKRNQAITAKLVEAGSQ